MARKRRIASHAGPHKLMRINWRTRQGDKSKPYYIFKCQIPGCSFYKPRDLVVGDMTECWRCGCVFQMTYASTYLAKPHCLNCTEGKKGAPSVKDVESVLDKLLGDI